MSEDKVCVVSGFLTGFLPAIHIIMCYGIYVRLYEALHMSLYIRHTRPELPWRVFSLTFGSGTQLEQTNFSP
ncbi:hypothetical protein BGX38DRAFT_1204151 [Terfezia claveryi]|nr:hypothetical protein BGX38DRAFT_1204151 [Terfezia claveryi]